MNLIRKITNLDGSDKLMQNLRECSISWPTGLATNPHAVQQVSQFIGSSWIAISMGLVTSSSECIRQRIFSQTHFVSLAICCSFLWQTSHTQNVCINRSSCRLRFFLLQWIWQKNIIQCVYYGYFEVMPSFIERMSWSWIGHKRHDVATPRINDVVIDQLVQNKQITNKSQYINNYTSHLMRFGTVSPCNLEGQPFWEVNNERCGWKVLF